MKKIHLAIFVGALVLTLGIGTVYALNSSQTKNDEIRLKQEMKPQDAESSTELIGTFAPGFEAELSEAKAEYAKAYGEGNFQVLEYNGYTLIVPPSASGLDDAKAKIDNAVINQQSGDSSQVTTIREVFGVEGKITFSPFLGAYTDEKGFQYIFQNGKLISKQVGVTSALHAKFEQTYPHLKSGVARSATVSTEQARTKADQIVDKAFTSGEANNLKANVKTVDLGEARVGFLYGDKVHVLIDQATGDVIGFNQ